MIDTLKQNPSIKHGNIAIAFTPDEEVGGGIEKFDIEGWGAKFAYTVDGEQLGDISNETWSARTATVTFHGTLDASGNGEGDNDQFVVRRGRFSFAFSGNDPEPPGNDRRP